MRNNVSKGPTHGLFEKGERTRIIMMHMMRKQPSTSRPPLPIILPTVLVTPMAPSPMTMMVSRLMRSIRCVFLKLSMRQKHDIVITTTASTTIRTYHTMYKALGGNFVELYAGVIAAKTPVPTR
jgi:hypothetical protein